MDLAGLKKYFLSLLQRWSFLKGGLSLQYKDTNIYKNGSKTGLGYLFVLAK